MTLSEFQQHMQRKLDLNLNRGGWEEDTFSYLIARAQEELDELKKSLINRRHSRVVIGDAADVANFCYMIADNVQQSEI